MRVTVEPLSKISYVKNGWLGPKTITESGYFLKLDFDLTAEEKAVLDKHKLWHEVLYEAPNLYYQEHLAEWEEYEDAKKSHIEMVRWTAKQPKCPRPSKSVKVTVVQFCTPRTERFHTQAEAKNFAADLQQKYLPLIKEVIDYNKKPFQKQTFDI